MIKKCVVFILLCLTIISSLIAAENSKEQDQIKILASTFGAFETSKANEIWPGFKLNECPSVIHFNKGNIYSFYLPFAPKWKKESIQQQTVLVSDYDHWDVTKEMMHPAFPIQGQKAFVFHFDDGQVPSFLNLPLLTFVHERFHLYQFDHFQNPEGRFARYVDEWSEDNQVLIELEHQLLKKFLSHPQQPDQQKQFLKDFIAVNTMRLKLLKPSSIAWEDLQQRMEGLADYVSIKAFEVFPLMDSFSVGEALLEMREKKTGKNYSLVNDAIKGRHYFVGAVLGFALDVCQYDWKARVERGESLRHLLVQALNVSQDELQSRFVRIKNSTEFNEIKRQVQTKLNQEKKELDQMLQSYKETSGISVYVSRPLRQPISGGGHNRKCCHIGDGHMLSLVDTSFSSSRDQQWKLNFKEIPFVFEDPVGGRVFKLQPDSIMTVDDFSISMNDFRTGSRVLNFHSISWQDQHCDFTANLPGQIRSLDGKIYIKFQH